ncbi:MAG: beta-lactamase family protein [Clostridia bacterium]|nr:beta-lactamase family protein [Clostridia bacterium]
MIHKNIADIIQKNFAEWNKEEAFSGVYSVAAADTLLFEKACGHRNRPERLPNELSTAFAIASGTKLFTGLAVCKLIDEGKLSLEDRIWDILPMDLNNIDKRVTLQHLLTHTSGIGDYIDEEAPGSYEALIALNHKYPVYLWNSLSYYLPMFDSLAPKFTPGARFGYSNAGFVLLGLAVESASGQRYQEYVTEHIITPNRLEHTGFYRMDRLPANTALGYIQDEDSGEWYANIFSMPVIGGADGGLFTCAADLDKLWRSLFVGKILSPQMLERFLTPHVVAGSEGDNIHYGLGVYQYRKGGQTAYYAVGGDFGIDFFTAYFPREGIVASALGNTEMNTWPLLKLLFEILL